MTFSAGNGLPSHAREHAAGARSPHEGGARLAQRKRARRGGGLTQFLTKDQVGSVVLVTNSAGEIVQRIEYDAFGVALRDTNPSLQPFGFAGGIQDPETGLIRFGARD